LDSLRSILMFYFLTYLDVFLAIFLGCGTTDPTPPPFVPDLTLDTMRLHNAGLDFLAVCIN